MIVSISVLVSLTALAEEEYYAIYRVEWKGSEGNYIIGKIKVSFSQGYYGISTDYKVIEVEDYSGDFGGFSPEDTLDYMISVNNMVFDFYRDPQSLSDGHIHNEIPLDNESTLIIDLNYDRDNGVLQNAYISSKSTGKGEAGYTRYTLLETNVKPGVLGEQSAETQTYTSGETTTYSEKPMQAETSTIANQGTNTVQQETLVKEGDWATYRINFDITGNQGEYAKGSATFKVVFHGTYYDITDVKVESLDTNTENVSESDVESMVRTLTIISPFLVAKENIPSNGVLEGQKGGVSYKLEYDPQTGILKTATLKAENTEGSGTITIGLIDTSVKNVAPPSTTLAPVGGTSGGSLGGLTTIILVIVIVVAAAVAGIVFFLKRRKPKTAPYPYMPPPPPPPPQ